MFLPGESQGWGRIESDTTEVTSSNSSSVLSLYPSRDRGCLSLDPCSISDGLEQQLTCKRYVINICSVKKNTYKLKFCN